MRNAALALLVSVGMVVAGCAGQSKQTTGTAVGAVTGAAIGSAVGGRSIGGRVAGALIGGALGAFVGSEIGRALDERDRRLQAQAANRSMSYGQTGRTRQWRNQRSGNRGAITPTSAKYRDDGRVCRNFQETITLANGKSDTVTGKRCQKSDGSWEFIG